MNLRKNLDTTFHLKVGSFVGSFGHIVGSFFGKGKMPSQIAPVAAFSLLTHEALSSYFILY